VVAAITMARFEKDACGHDVRVVRAYAGPEVPVTRRAWILEVAGKYSLAPLGPVHHPGPMKFSPVPPASMPLETT
jgi:hypothetical protein